MLIDGLSKGRRLKDAQQIFKDLLIRGYNVDVVTFKNMISGLC